MDYREVAAGVLEAIGGAANVGEVSTCLTRLRLTLVDAGKADLDELKGIRGVLGLMPRGTNRLEVVLGPTAIEGVAREFAIQSNQVLGDSTSCANPIVELASTPRTPTAPKQPADDDETPRTGGFPVTITAGRKRSYRAQQRAAIEDERLGKDDIDALKAFLEKDEQPAERMTVSLGAPREESLGHAVLVINGPNINMLGVREPKIYGHEDYATLVSICKDAAHKAGFVDVKCFQSNHEGAIVDEIQAALGSFDGIVINPAAYTHTSVAILDAVKAVGLPCVEVHISKVEEREDFRQVSYVRQACFETVTGMGLDGYRKAIFDLAAKIGV